MNLNEASALAVADSATYSFGENPEHTGAEHAMALVALSHTPIEQQLYAAMLAEIAKVRTCIASFSIRRLMSLTGIAGYSSVRRGLIGLSNKLSIERQRVAGHNGGSHPLVVYIVFTPAEILARRRAAGAPAYVAESGSGLASFANPLKRIGNLSRREAQVALCCAQGLTNAEIGAKLRVSEQTVKFHLRHIFVKFGVKRRAELVSRLFREGSTDFDL